MSTKVMLKSATSGRRVYNSNMDITFEFIVIHDNKKTKLDQILKIERVENGYRSSLSLEQMPFTDTPQASVTKLTDWLDRLSEALKDHDFDRINLNDL